MLRRRGQMTALETANNTEPNTGREQARGYTFLFVELLFHRRSVAGMQLSDIAGCSSVMVRR